MVFLRHNPPDNLLLNQPDNRQDNQVVSHQDNQQGNQHLNLLDFLLVNLLLNRPDGHLANLLQFLLTSQRRFQVRNPVLIQQVIHHPSQHANLRFNLWSLLQLSPAANHRQPLQCAHLLSRRAIQRFNHQCSLQVHQHHNHLMPHHGNHMRDHQCSHQPSHRPNRLISRQLSHRMNRAANLPCNLPNSLLSNHRHNLLVNLSLDQQPALPAYQLHLRQTSQQCSLLGCLPCSQQLHLQLNRLQHQPFNHHHNHHHNPQ